MARDQDALLLQMSADIRSLERQMTRARDVVDKTATGAERRFRAMNDNMSSTFSRSNLGREFNQLGQDIGRGFQTASRTAQVALLGISAVAIKLASDAAEIESAFDVAFGKAADSARDFSNVLTQRVGRDAVEVRDAMTRLQLVLTGTGVAAEQAAEMTKRLTEAGIDAGSLFKTSDAEALQKIVSGLTGETEPLKAFGVVINDTAVKAELLRLGFKGNATEASEAAKSIARANLIIEKLAVAQGDATRTAGSAENQMKRTRAEFNAAARDLGQQLLPAFTKLTKAAGDTLRAFNDLPGGVQVAGLSILAFIAAGGPIAGLLANLGRVIKLAKETRAAIAGIGATNAGAGAAGAAAGLGARAATGLAVGAGAAVGTAVAGGALIVQGRNFNKTVSNVRDATNAEISRALEIATASLKAAQSGGPAGKNRAEKMGRAIAKLTAEQARRGLEEAASGITPGGAVNPTTVQGGFSLSGSQLQANGSGGSSRTRAARQESQRLTEIELQQNLRIEDLRDQIEIARAAGNAKNADALQDELDLLQKIADLRQQGFDAAAATARASAFIANRALARDLSANRDRLQDLANPEGFVSTEDRMTEFAEGFAKVEDGASRLTEEFDVLLDNGINRLVDGLSAAAVGAADLGDVFRQTIQQMAIDANRLLLQSLLGTGESSGGGFLKSLFKFGSSAFSGGYTGNGGAFAIKGIDGGFIPYASGTNSARGGLSLVGERGPELLNIPRGAQVIPNDILRTMARSRASNVNNSRNLTWSGNVVIQAAPGMSAAEARRTGAQAAAGAMRELALARKRGY